MVINIFDSVHYDGIVLTPSQYYIYANTSQLKEKSNKNNCYVPNRLRLSYDFLLLRYCLESLSGLFRHLPEVDVRQIEFQIIFELCKGHVLPR